MTLRSILGKPLVAILTSTVNREELCKIPNRDKDIILM